MKQSPKLPETNAPIGGVAPLLPAVSYAHRWLAPAPILRQPRYQVLIAGQLAPKAPCWQTTTAYRTKQLGWPTTDASHGGVSARTQAPRPEPASEPEPESEDVPESEMQNEPETEPDERPSPRGRGAAKEESGDRHDGGVNPPFK